MAFIEDVASWFLPRLSRRTGVPVSPEVERIAFFAVDSTYGS